MDRRRVILGAAGLVSLAGCLSEDEGEIEEYERGEMDIVIDGEPVDLEADRFQAEHAESSTIDFHFHESDEYWYMEGDERLTYATAIDYIPHFEYTTEDDEHVLTYDGTTYDTSEPGTSITFGRNDEAVDPTDQQLYDGDELRVEVTTDAS